MYTHDKLRLEDEERERKYLESIGPLGRIIDGHLTYVLFLCFIFPIGFGIGLGIGFLL